jgi:multiple sugar transport system substrate-binding protein
MLKAGAILFTAIALATLSASAQDARKVEIVFRQFDPPNEIAALTAAVQTWNTSNPRMQVRLESIASNDALNAYAREVQAGGGPDVAQLGFAWIPDLTRSKLLLQLDPLISESPLARGIQDFLATDLTVSDGNVHAVPWTADTFAMAYRPDFFEKAGLAAFPKTWAALLEAARRLTADVNGDGRTEQYGFCFAAGSGLNSSTWFLVNYYLWSNGSSLVQRDAGGKWQPGVTVASLASAMRYFDAFFTSGASPRSLIALTTYADPEITGGLGRGECAIGFFPPQTFRAAQAASKNPLRTGLVPSGTSAQISHLGGRALVINPNSKHPKEAWAFLKYLVSADVMQNLPQYPAQRTLLKTIKFADAEQGFVEMLPQAVTFKRYTDSPAPLPGLATATTREFAAVFSGQKSPERAADDLIRGISSLLGGK